jgi:hypothetical protein
MLLEYRNPYTYPKAWYEWPRKDRFQEIEGFAGPNDASPNQGVSLPPSRLSNNLYLPIISSSKRQTTWVYLHEL